MDAKKIKEHAETLKAYAKDCESKLGFGSVPEDVKDAIADLEKAGEKAKPTHKEA